MSCENALQKFIAESRELLQIMEAALLCVEQGKMDADILGAVCRTANTIKGNAGLFGLAQVVGFIHVTESVLDKVRGAHLCVDRELSVLLLECIDHIGVLIEDLERGAAPSELAQLRCNDLTHRLVACVESERASLRSRSRVEQTIEESGVASDPSSPLCDYLALLQACSSQEIGFEEMLKRFGVLTHAELTRLLQRQVQAGATETEEYLSRLADQIRDSSPKLGIVPYALASTRRSGSRY